LPFIGLEIPYQIWRFSHRFMGALFAIVVFHQFFVDMPTEVDPSLSVLLNTFGIAGVIAWIFTELVAPYLRRREFTVTEISQTKDTTTLTLRAERRAMRWRSSMRAHPVGGSWVSMLTRRPVRRRGLASMDGDSRWS